MQDARELTAKVQRSGPWSNHSRVMAQAVESMWQRANWNTDADLFIKRLMIDVGKRPPWDFQGRLDTACGLVGGRYGLNDEQTKKLKVKLFQNWVAFFLQNAEKFMPVARGMIETRLANKPFTPERVAEWTKVTRPMMERWYARTSRDMRQFAAQNLTPEQQAKFKEDLGVFDRRADETRRAMVRWEKGEWMPESWGLENDQVHMALQAQLAEAKRARELAAKTPDRPKPAAAPKPAASPTTPPPKARLNRFKRRGPMRVGQTPQRTTSGPAREASSLPDETKWVAYVRDFCTRYGLDKAQQASAYAILKDLQEQAQTYRTSRVEDIKRLEAQNRQASTPEERRDAQAELREVLRGIDELFEELKARLDKIPTAEQLRQAG